MIVKVFMFKCLQMTLKDSLYIGCLKHIVRDLFLKIMNNLSQIFLEELFAKNMVPYDLRNDYALDITRCKTVAYGINSLHYQDTKFLGRLETKAKNSESIVEFRRLLC